MSRRLGFALLVALLFAAAVALAWLDFAAYRQRFPHAGWWTYFFRGSG